MLTPANSRTKPQGIIQTEKNFGGQHSSATDVVLNHTLGGLAGPVRTIVRIAENCVIPELAGADVETLNHFRKEGVFDVRHDDAERPTIARGEVARVNIRELPPKRFTVESTSRCVRRPTLPV